MNHQQHALNSLNVQCLEAADLYEDSANLVEEPRLAGIFRKFAAKHRAYSLELEEHVLRIGLPRRPDPEKEILERLRSRVKKLLSRDEEQSLIKDRLDAERQLAETARTILNEEKLPDDTLALVRQIHEASTSSQADLERLSWDEKPGSE